MTEEEKNNLVEKEIIKRIDYILDKANYLDFEGKKEYISFKREYLQDLFDLCKKQQKEIKELNLENQAFYEEMNCDDNEYISKKYSQLKSVVETLANGIRVLGTNPDITTEEIIKEFTEKPITEEYMEEFKSRYISKDKVLKALGYEENGEEYKRIYNKEELILSLIRTINEECDRLEDIEDQKVMLEIHNIENQRDKYWQEKISNKIKELEKQEDWYREHSSVSELEGRIEELKELLED